MPLESGVSDHVCPRSLLGKHNYITLHLHGVAEPQIGFSTFRKCRRHPDDAGGSQYMTLFTTFNLCCKVGLCTRWWKLNSFVFWHLFLSFTSDTTVKDTVRGVSAHGSANVDCFRVRRHTHAHVAKGNHAFKRTRPFLQCPSDLSRCRI